MPAPDGPFAYYTRYREGGEHPLICRRPRADITSDNETILLDGDELAKGKAFFQLSSSAHSPDHRLLAWSCDDKGSELDVIRIRDLASGADLPDEIHETTGGVVWSADGRSFHYVRYDAEHRPRTVLRHVLGMPSTADTVVYHEDDPGFFVGIGRTQSRAFLVIEIHDHRTSETRLLDLASDAAEPRVVAAREVGVQYSVEHLGERLIIRSNRGGAVDFELLEAPLADPRAENWRALVPHRVGVYVLAHEVLADWILRLEREEGLPRIVARRVTTGEEHVVGFDEEAYALGFSTGYEFQTDTIRFTYSSPTTPAETWDYDLTKRTRTFRKRQEVPSGHEPVDYVTRRLFATAPDGERVPITVLHHRSTPIDGTAPLYLYGYGAYGHALPAGFRTGVLSLVDRGVVHAVAHVRGGTEKGRRWYENGKLEHKTNTFTDFIAAAEHLIATRYARPDGIVAHGGSAGGMLMGAIANMRPDLFAGIVAEVPFVDVLATMLDDTLPLTPPEWPEWGNPIADGQAFHRILGYSPYDQVGPKPYPTILAIGGLTDPRVTYWEPAKWAAKVRAQTTSGRPVLLHTNMSAGHGGAAGRFEALKETAMIQAFVLSVVGRAKTRAKRRRRKAA